MADATDCIDALFSVHPNAPEVVADGVDQDCDGGDICREDTDNDGFGNPGSSVASKDIDCADPGEASNELETCEGGDDALDTDHDGTPDGCDPVQDPVETADTGVSALPSTSDRELGSANPTGVGCDCDETGAGSSIAWLGALVAIGTTRRRRGVAPGTPT